MDFIFGEKSQKKLHLLSYKLQQVLREVLSLGIMDFSIIETFRDEETQNKAFEEGKSKVNWPNSKHNLHPAEAADCVPYINGEISWNQFHCCVLAGIILAIAEKLGVEIRWGGNWDRDEEPITDQDFQDLVHFEEV